MFGLDMLARFMKRFSYKERRGGMTMDACTCYDGDNHTPECDQRFETNIRFVEIVKEEGKRK